MKKILLSLAAASLALSAAAQTVYFEDDFEWLKPWVEAGNNKGMKAGDTIGENGKGEDNGEAYCPQLTTPKVDNVSAYDALTSKGYSFLAAHASSKAEREPGKQIYLNNGYLKFGLTAYFSGVTLPKIEKLGEGVSDAILSFDWCTMRRGNGSFDKTEIVVLVKNGEVTTPFIVKPLEIEDNADFKWYPATVKLEGVKLTKDSQISIRNVDSQWPAGAKDLYRYFLDNLKVYAEGGSGVAGIEAEENAPVEYYNLQGIRVANPENGLYIVKQGNKVTKRVIK